MKNIWIVLRSSIHTRRPIMSVLRNLLDLGYSVNFISIESTRITNLNLKEYICDIESNKHHLSTFNGYIKFRAFTHKTLTEQSNHNDIVWLGSLDTVNACTGLAIFKKLKYICHISELYDQRKSRLYFSKKFIQNAHKVVVPELNRARILRVWLDLNDLPTLYPNKPWNHPRIKNMEPTTTLTKSIIQDCNTDKDIIIYQGHIGKDRSLKPIVEAIKDIDNVELWLMGKDHNYVNELTETTDKVRYLGFVPAPHHLEITSHAKLGIMSYNLSNLNNLYCAPNKVWEYLGFNIFFICNEVGSLDELVSTGCCKCVDFNNIELLKDIILEELGKEHDFSKIYEQVNLKQIISNLLD